MFPQPLQPVAPTPPKQYFGKYRGIVLNNIDPMQLGRILPQVPSVSPLIAWAMPCVPYPGAHFAGAFIIPPVGTNVWIEFEQGNIDNPIWSGCFWTAGHPPLI
jgi:Type VI secretion system/phage-baseplate injector OB domain